MDLFQIFITNIFKMEVIFAASILIELLSKYHVYLIHEMMNLMLIYSKVAQIVGSATN